MIHKLKTPSVLSVLVAGILSGCLGGGTSGSSTPASNTPGGTSTPAVQTEADKYLAALQGAGLNTVFDYSMFAPAYIQNDKRTVSLSGSSYTVTIASKYLDLTPITPTWSSTAPAGVVGIRQLVLGAAGWVSDFTTYSKNADGTIAVNYADTSATGTVTSKVLDGTLIVDTAYPGCGVGCVSPTAPASFATAVFPAGSLGYSVVTSAFTKDSYNLGQDPAWNVISDGLTVGNPQLTATPTTDFCANISASLTPYYFAATATANVFDVCVFRSIVTGHFAKS